jgi:succinate dehydrogenase / fumarate reductase cytochrome b subunit
VTTILLVKQNRAARNTPYAYHATVQASSSSRTMIWSGLIILAFVIYHLMHYTLRIGNEYGGASYLDSAGRHDVYKMVVDGFSWAPASLFYIFAMALLCWHLSHGFASIFQTLGLRTDGSWPLIKSAGHVVAGVLFVGNISIPLAVMLGWVSY